MTRPKTKIAVSIAILAIVVFEKPPGFQREIRKLLNNTKGADGSKLFHAHARQIENKTAAHFRRSMSFFQFQVDTILHRFDGSRLPVDVHNAAQNGTAKNCGEIHLTGGL